MVDERPRRRPDIVRAVVAAGGIEATIYDAARRYRTDLAARAACLDALVQDLAAPGGETHWSWNRTNRYSASTTSGSLRPHAPPDNATDCATNTCALTPNRCWPFPTWCWVRSGTWRQRITPILTAVRTV